MTETCKTCKYWEEAEEDPSGRLKTCEQPKAKIGYAWVQSEMKDDEVLIENDEGWGWLLGPDFGCINHEKRQ